MTMVSPLNGGAALIGKRGRKTPKLSDASAKETNRNTAAHFMFSALIRSDRALAS
jgi:hypothetical protein